MTWREGPEIRPMVLISGLPVGGAETVTTQFLCHLAATGRPVPVCTLTDRHDGAPADDLAGAGVERYDLDARRLADPRALTRLVGLLRRHDIDLLHAHGQDASILAAAVSVLEPTRLVVTRHVLDEPRETVRQRARASLALAALRRAHAVVAVSRAVGRRVRDDAALPDRRIRVIPNGIEASPFDPERLQGVRGAVRCSLGLPEGARVVLVPSVLREGKGHELLLAALPALRKRSPDIRVLFAGGGERGEALRREARARGVDDLVHFLGFRDDIPELLHAADLVALPSWAEALPTVLMEAAWAGRPVVATRVGGVPEVVEDGRTGLLVPVDDVPALIQALATLLEDGERARRFGWEARSLAEARFGMGRQVERTLDLWAEVAAGRVGALP